MYDPYILYMQNLPSNSLVGGSAPININMSRITGGSTFYSIVQLWQLTYHFALIMHHCSQIPKNLIDVHDIVLQVQRHKVIVFLTTEHTHLQLVHLSLTLLQSQGVVLHLSLPLGMEMWVRTANISITQSMEKGQPDTSGIGQWNLHFITV